MTNGKFIEGGRALLTQQLQQAVRTATPETVQTFVDLLVDVVEGRKTPIEMRDALGCPGDLQSLFQNLSHLGSVPNPGGGAPLLDLHGQINLGSQIVQDLVAGNQVKIIINNADGSTEVISSDPPRRMIYLSHLAKEPDAQALLEEIATALRQAGYTVPPHEERLTNSACWQPELFDQIGHCQGAVILLSPAALRSELVASEAALLLSRPTKSPYPYVLCKVYAAGVDDDKLALSPLANLPWLDEAISVPGTAGTAPSATAIAAEVVHKMDGELQNLPDWFRSPLTVIEQSIAAHFSKTPATELRTAIRTLSDTLPTALSAPDLCVKLAQALLRSNLHDTYPAFDILRRANVPLDAIAQIFQLVAAAWVDPRSASWVVLATRRPARQRALGLNTCNPDTAQFCVWRACNLRPDSLLQPPNPGSAPVPRWAIVPITNSGGALLHQGQSDDLVREVSDRLLRFSRLPVTKLPAWLDWLEKRGEPVLVPILSEYPNQLIPTQALDALQCAFPTVTFLLLLGGGPLPSAEAWPLKPMPLIHPDLNDDTNIITEYEFAGMFYAPHS